MRRLRNILFNMQSALHCIALFGRLPTVTFILGLCEHRLLKVAFCEDSPHLVGILIVG